MPIYEYVCTACDHRTDILHGINDPIPHYCPSCGREGTMRKLFAPPTIHYKGSGWAKKDRGASTSRAKPAAAAPAAGETGSAAGAAESSTPPASSSDSTPTPSGPGD
jgi:putative FmdB family regulatory protein